MTFKAYKYTITDLFNYYNNISLLNKNFNDIDEFYNYMRDIIENNYFMNFYKNNYLQYYINFNKNIKNNKEINDKLIDDIRCVTKNIFASKHYMIFYDILLKGYMTLKYNIKNLFNNAYTQHFYYEKNNVVDNFLNDPRIVFFGMKDVNEISLFDSYLLKFPDAFFTGMYYTYIRINDSNEYIFRNMTNIINSDFNDELISDINDYLIEMQYYNCFTHTDKLKFKHVGLKNFDTDLIVSFTC